jgi:hypothetical protein
MTLFFSSMVVKPRYRSLEESYRIFGTDRLTMTAEKAFPGIIHSPLINQNDGPIGTDLPTKSTACTFFLINVYLFHDYLYG